MKTIKASEFKAKCLRLMDEVAEGGSFVVITKHGRPVARLVAYRDKPATLWGLHRDQVDIAGDLVAPLDEAWEVDA